MAEEQNLPVNVMAKRIWRIMRVMYVMLRKGISSKRKLLLDLNMLMKRGKLAGKAAITNLVTLHLNSSSSCSSGLVSAGDYEFSCSNTPIFPHLTKNHHHHHHHHHNFFACAQAPPTQDDDDAVTASAVSAVLELLNGSGNPAAASPAMPGFGRSPAVTRQLRITDSPFPLREADQVDSRPVDEAAEAFIKRFYSDLSRQRKASSSLAD